MSLGKLLTSGRSLVGGNNSAVQYRMTSPKAMPKFGAARNPFRSTATPESVTEEAAPVSPALPLAPHEPSEEKVVEPAVPVNAGQSSKSPSWLARWGSKITGWFSRPGPKPLKPAVPRFEKTPVQAELSLDRIQVLRNDLSDADLELVPARPAPKPSRKPEGELPIQPAPVVESGAPGVQSVEKPGMARAAWERANRLLTMNRG